MWFKDLEVIQMQASSEGDIRMFAAHQRCSSKDRVGHALPGNGSGSTVSAAEIAQGEITKIRKDCRVVIIQKGRRPTEWDAVIGKFTRRKR